MAVEVTIITDATPESIRELVGLPRTTGLLTLPSFVTFFLGPQRLTDEDIEAFVSDYGENLDNEERAAIVSTWQAGRQYPGFEGRVAVNVLKAAAQLASRLGKSWLLLEDDAGDLRAGFYKPERFLAE
jgi:hypothetical protein